uniref:Phage integrase family protein n=1 Tax=Cereibacter sphaeroides (strain ATCC 17025 / ATH 2.4.3) TaxID=349102 RepID=A4WQG8_CERS5
MHHRRRGTYHLIRWLPEPSLAGRRIPVLLVEPDHGTILYEAWWYFTCRETATKSDSWKIVAARTIGRFYDSCRVEGLADKILGNELPPTYAENLIQKYLTRLQFGTLEADGHDPTGLNWNPTSEKDVYNAIYHLRRFLLKLDDHMGNTSCAATRFARGAVNALAIERRRAKSPLFNSQPKTQSVWTAATAAHPIIRARGFPLQLLPRLISTGCRRNHPIMEFRGPNGAPTTASDFNINLLMAVLLMAGGGLRTSEIFHIYVDDVSPTEVRLYHPSEGQVYDGHRVVRRDIYLQRVFGLKPRHLIRGQQKAGWKNIEITESGNWSPVYFLPGWQQWFYEVFRAYRQYVMKDRTHHPYLFVSTDAASACDPWTIGALRKAFEKALNKIGVEQRHSDGTTPHGMRHAYGQALVNAGVHPILIKTCMHHCDLDSQLVYTRPDPGKVNKQLQEAYAASFAEASSSRPYASGITTESILDYNFTADPLGMFRQLELEPQHGFR